MNLLDIYKELNTEEKCLTFLEHMRWPEGVKCLSCNSDRVSHIVSKGKTNKKSGRTSPDRHLLQCNECRFQFSATTGTVYHDTHLPLGKWFLAIALITESKKGISANQLSRALGVQYRTAWYLAHRIRKAMVDANAPKLKGIVEIDETYIGGKQRTHRNKLKNKDVVMGIRERGGDLRLVHVESNSAARIAFADAMCRISRLRVPIVTEWRSLKWTATRKATGHLTAVLTSRPLRRSASRLVHADAASFAVKNPRNTPSLKALRTSNACNAVKTNGA